MNKLKKSYIIIVLVFFLTVINLNRHNLKISTVQGTIKPVNESDIVIGFDMYHENGINSTEIANLTTILNTTFSSQEVVFLTQELSQSSLEIIDVLTIFAPTTSFTEGEINAVEDFIKKGKSIIVATGYRSQTNEPSNGLLNVYGLTFNNNDSITSENYLARNFTTPITPLTENISQIICPNSMGISFNKSKLESYQSPRILYYNPILLYNATEEPSENNTLISSLEFENGARILAIGSSDLFKNSFIEPLPNTTVNLLDNTDFYLNAIKWLGKNTGILTFYNPWVNLQDRSIGIGEVIHGNVTLVDSQNKSVSQVQLSIALERTGSILGSRLMQMNPKNSSQFFGSVSTEGLSHGYFDVVFIANRVGYLSIEFSASRLYIEAPFPSPIPPNMALWGLFFASSLLFFSSAVFTYMNLKKKE